MSERLELVRLARFPGERDRDLGDGMKSPTTPIRWVKQIHLFHSK